MKKLLALVFGFIFLPTTLLAYDCTDTATSGVPENQCDALVRLYNELDGDNWTDNTNWLVDTTSIEDRYGISTNGGQLHTIVFSANNLHGSLSSRKGMETVSEIIITLSDLQGIPTSRTGLENISNINFDKSNIKQEFPTNGIEYISWATISIKNNKFYWEIPTEFITFLGENIKGNYFHTDVEEPLLSHLNNYFFLWLWW